MKTSTILGGVLTAALTVGGVFVGRALTSADEAATTTSPLQIPATEFVTETLPIISPIAVGDQPPAEPDPDDVTLGLGDVVGTDEAIVLDPAALDSPPPSPPALVPYNPASAPPEPPAGWSPTIEPGTLGGDGAIPLPEALAEIGLADDPAAAEPAETDGAGDTSDSAEPLTIDFISLLPFDLRFADPCAPASGDPADGCPEGVRSTVLGLEAAPELWLMGYRNRAATGGSGNSSCPTRDAPSADQLGLTFTANAPGTVTAWVQSVRDPSDVVLATASTDAADQARWDALLPVVTPEDSWQLNVPFCMVLDEFPDDTQLTVNATVTDHLGRSANFQFAIDVLTPGRPPTRVLPLGPNLLLVSVAHREDEYVDTRGIVATDGGSGCAARGYELFAERFAPAEVPVSWLNNRRYDREYTQRSNVLFEVPDASTVSICSRTYDTLLPSYDRSVPILTEEFVVDSPDLLIPTITVESISGIARTGAARLTTVLNFVRGNGCGVAGVEVAEDGTVTGSGSTLCDPNLDPAWLAGQVHQNIRVTTSVNRRNQDPVTTSAVLNTAARRCNVTGVPGGPVYCPRLDTEWYRVPFGLVSVPAGICSPGLFESTCEPPRRDAVAAYAVVRVDWTNNRSNNRATWSVVPAARAVPDGELPVVPRLNEDIGVVASGGVFPVVSGTLQADRPVNWTVFADDCLLPENAASASSTTPSSTFTVRLSGLCTGMGHTIRVVITDPVTGASASYNTGEGPHAVRWANGFVYVAAPETRVTVHVTAAPEISRELPYWKIDTLDVFFSRPGHGYGQQIPFPFPVSRDPEFACYLQNNAVTGLRGFSREVFGVALELPEEVEISVVASITPASSRCGVAGRPVAVRFSGTFTRDELLASDRVTLQSPDGSEFTVQVVIRKP